MKQITLSARKLSGSIIPGVALFNCLGLFFYDIFPFLVNRPQVLVQLTQAKVKERERSPALIYRNVVSMVSLA